MAWACSINKVQELSLPKSVISLELEKQKPFRPGQIHVALTRVTNIESLYLTGTCKKDAISANIEALHEYDQLQKEVLLTPVSLPMSLPETISFILLNVRSLKRHAIDIAYDKKLIKCDILFLTIKSNRRFKCYTTEYS